MCKFTRLFLFLAGAATLASQAATAHACGALPCSAPTLAPAASALPANTGALFVDADPDALTASLEELPAVGDPIPLAAELVARPAGGTWVVPAGALEVAKRYRVSARIACEVGPSDAGVAMPLEFVVSEAVAVPESLGATVAIGQGLGQVPVAESAGCWDRLNVGYVDVRPDFATVAPSFQPALTNYRVIVDGEPFSWPMSANGVLALEDVGDPFAGEPWREPDTFRLWTACGALDEWQEDASAYGLAQGTHEAYVEAEIPGPEGAVVKSTPVTIQLRCCEPGASGCADGSGDGVSDGDDSDGESGDGDDGQYSDGSTEDLVTRDDGGCAIGATKPAGSVFAPGWLMLAALVTLRVRRAR